jgi:hypothetical protein
MKSNEFLQNEVKQLSRKLRAAYLIFGAILLAQAAMFFGTNSQADGEIVDNSGKIIKAKGIIIVDEQGRERVLIGAPIPQAKNRIFTDKKRAIEAWKDRMPLERGKQYWDNFDNLHKMPVGMLVLDENGFDRLGVGDQLGDVNTGRRIGNPTGIFMNNEKGFERAGFGVMTVNGVTQVGLGMDADYGEALTLAVSKDIGGGLRINDSKNQVFFGTLPPNKWENKSDLPFSGYMFRQGEETKYLFNSLEKK